MRLHEDACNDLAATCTNCIDTKHSLPQPFMVFTYLKTGDFLFYPSSNIMGWAECGELLLFSFFPGGQWFCAEFFLFRLFNSDQRGSSSPSFGKFGASIFCGIFVTLFIDSSFEAPNAPMIKFSFVQTTLVGVTGWMIFYAKHKTENSPAWNAVKLFIRALVLASNIVLLYAWFT